MKRDMKTRQCKLSVLTTQSLFTLEQFLNITISDTSLYMRFKAILQ